jgi:hypothetical protein
MLRLSRARRSSLKKPSIRPLISMTATSSEPLGCHPHTRCRNKQPPSHRAASSPCQRPDERAHGSSHPKRRSDHPRPALGTAIGGSVSPLLIGWLIESGSAWRVSFGYGIAALLLLLAAGTELKFGVNAEGKSLESIEQRQHPACASSGTFFTQRIQTLWRLSNRARGLIFAELVDGCSHLGTLRTQPTPCSRVNLYRDRLKLRTGRVLRCGEHSLQAQPPLSLARLRRPA